MDEHNLKHAGMAKQSSNAPLRQADMAEQSSISLPRVEADPSDVEISC